MFSPIGMPLLVLQNAPSRRTAGAGRGAASVARSTKLTKQRGGARLPVAAGDEVADLLDAGDLLRHTSQPQCRRCSTAAARGFNHSMSQAAMLPQRRVATLSCPWLDPSAGTARQMMRSAAGQDRQQGEMDDFARDMGSRMLIKVCCIQGCIHFEGSRRPARAVSVIGGPLHPSKH